MSFTVARRIQFCAGHRVFEHGSKCRNIHGHNYVAMIYAQSTSLDGMGMVIDFSVLKEKVGTWIDTYWDHGFIYYEKDESISRILDVFEKEEHKSEPHFFQKAYALPYNPTAENMAYHLIQISNTLLDGTGVRVPKVKLWETENCFAVAEYSSSLLSLVPRQASLVGSTTPAPLPLDPQAIRNY